MVSINGLFLTWLFVTKQEESETASLYAPLWAQVLKDNYIPAVCIIITKLKVELQLPFSKLWDHNFYS